VQLRPHPIPLSRLTARIAYLVCFISTVNGHCNKKRKEKEKLTLGRPASSIGHTTNLKQSILETFNIYDGNMATWQNDILATKDI
jgi:hypothetical protein